MGKNVWSKFGIGGGGTVFNFWFFGLFIFCFILNESKKKKIKRVGLYRGREEEEEIRGKVSL